MPRLSPSWFTSTRPARWAPLAVVVLLGAGIAPEPPPDPAGRDIYAIPTARPAPSPLPGGGIRDFDFANAEWSLVRTPRPVRFRNGTANLSDVTGHVRLLPPPIFADADGDGDLDAAVAVNLTDENYTDETWYAWLWQDGRAVQVQRPIAVGARCSDNVAGVTAGQGGFRVDMKIKRAKDACAGGGTVPVTYVVGVRDGLPVQVQPTIAPAEWCLPEEHTTELPPGTPAVPRLAPFPEAPVVPGATGTYAQIRLNSSKTDTDAAGHRWYLALLSGTDGSSLCGWVQSG
jgi:hypothetical protein